MPAGADPEAFEPRPSDLAKLKDARIVIRVGLGYDHWLDKLLSLRADKTINRGGVRMGTSELYRSDDSDRRIQHVVRSFMNFPVVVLVNGETTGGAELIAAVLQDNRRALLAGQRTRGKASVQRKFSLTGEVTGLSLTVPVPNMELKLTTGILVRPSPRASSVSTHGGRTSKTLTLSRSSARRERARE